MYKKVYTHVCLTSGILLCTKMGILSAQQRCELYILSFNHVQEYSKGLGVAQLTSAIMICVTNISQARRPICRLEDVRHGETEAYHLEGCEHLDLAFADIKDSGAYALASQLDGNQGIKRIYLTVCITLKTNVIVIEYHRDVDLVRMELVPSRKGSEKATLKNCTYGRTTLVMKVPQRLPSI
eukprot:m.28215 g.28215  ORF g.28215 m.28215 type:complete len:182 (+) comp7982_c0_seq3:220-765(+)